MNSKFNSIKYKIKKYKHKLNICKNQYEKAVYLYKVSSYLTQLGGEFDYDTEAARISDEFMQMLNELKERNQALSELKNKVVEHNNIISDIFSNALAYNNNSELDSYYSDLQEQAREVVG